MPPRPYRCPRWNPDPSEHADYEGRLVCRTCQLPGRPGDSHHPKATPNQDHYQLDITEAWADRDAAILGERGDT